MICPACQHNVNIALGVEKCPLCGARMLTGSAVLRTASSFAPNPAAAGVPEGGVKADTEAQVKEPTPQILLPKVLLIEDDLFISEVYKRTLELSGYVVDIAMGGFEGEEKLKSNSYDMVLLDLMLPGVNGLDILKDIKKNEVTQKTPVIIVSNMEQDEIIDQGLLLGAAKYLTKAAISAQDLVAAVKEIVGR